MSKYTCTLPNQTGAFTIRGKAAVPEAWVEHHDGAYHVCIQTEAQVCEFEVGDYQPFADALARAVNDHARLHRALECGGGAVGKSFEPA